MVKLILILPFNAPVIVGVATKEKILPLRLKIRSLLAGVVENGALNKIFFLFVFKWPQRNYYKLIQLANKS